MAITGRAAGWIGRKVLRDALRQGEEILGVIREPGRDGDYWIITTLNVHILYKPSRANARSGHNRNFEIPRSDVTEVCQVPNEAQTALTISTVDEGIVRDFTGIFRTRDANVLARMLDETKV